MSTSLVEIKTGLDETQSQLFLVMLQEAGIKAELVDTNSTAALPHYAYTSIGVKVVVEKSQQTQALKILQDHCDYLNNVQEKPDRLLCPNCNSKDTKVSLWHWLVNLFGFATLLPARVARGRIRVCKDCGHRW